eukprot:3488138-Prymnesium_polylepis.1
MMKALALSAKWGSRGMACGAWVAVCLQSSGTSVAGGTPGTRERYGRVHACTSVKTSPDAAAEVNWS